jgi:hypothetical protein
MLSTMSTAQVDGVFSVEHGDLAITQPKFDGFRMRWAVARNRRHDRALGILDGGARDVAAGIRRRATGEGLKTSDRKGADTCASYLTNKAAYLDYPTALAQGWPIATGIIEGACHLIVKDRMDLTGARWSLDGAEAVLKLRALRSNGDFDSYWRFHLSHEQGRVHRSRYVDGAIPRAA